MRQYEDGAFAGCYNVGPEDEGCVNTGDLVTLFCDTWKAQAGNDLSWVNRHDGGPHEANFLKLDCSKMKNTFEWRPKWNIAQAMQKLVEWYRIYAKGENVNQCMEEQIREYLAL